MILAGDYIPKEYPVQIELPEELLICNLEAPVVGSNRFQPILKSGPNLKNRAIRDNFSRKIVALANNHMMDYGPDGLNSTIKALASAGCGFAGAGDALESARKPFIFHEAKKKVAFYSCCERQFGVADNATPGVAEMGSWLVAEISKIRKEVDFIIVSCHAASELSPWPSPRLRDFYHALIDAGCDIVHGHHAHVPQGYEVHGNGVVFYGLGNFVVVPDDWKTVKNGLWSYVVKVDFAQEPFSWKIIPCEIKQDQAAIRVVPSDGEVLNRRMAYLSVCNKAFASPLLLEAYWQEVASNLYRRMYSSTARCFSFHKEKISPKERLSLVFWGAVDILYGVCGWKIPFPCSKRYAVAYYNFFNCPSHADTIATALAVKSGLSLDLHTESVSNDVHSLLF